MATFTLPEKLRLVVRSHQKECYNILFKSSADSLKKLAMDKRFIGGKIAFSKKGFLMRVEPLSIIFKAKFRDAMKKAGLFELVPAEVWQQDWVVHIESVGNGENSLKYLAPYVYRIAISNSNILSCRNGFVTFRYKDSNTGKIKTMTLPAIEFIRRFLQHVFPKGFQKVRYFGFLHPKNRIQFDTLRLLLNPKLHAGKHTIKKDFIFKCPDCGKEMVLFDKTLRKRAPPLAALLSIQKGVY
jgi:hypothetical protein